MNVSIIGLGKLGSPMAAVFASKGHNVIGVDVNPDFVKAIQEGRPPVREPQLAELIAANRPRLRATQDYREAVHGSEITFMIVPTPSEADGGFSLKYTLSAVESIGAALRDKAGYHLVVLTSTVMPGATQSQILPALERASGRRVGPDLGLCYNPEFIALGSVVRDMLNPDFILVGESDEKAGRILEEFYPTVCDNKPRVTRMNFVNAELTKLAVNTFVTTKISYANMLAQVCERLPGADVDVVTSAIGQDSRIGRKYLKGALGYGGPCFPRDNVAFSSLSRRLGTPALLAEATDRTNHQQAPRLAEMVISRLPRGGRAAILGLSYKPHTEVIEESQGVALAMQLVERKVTVSLFDPAAIDNVRRVLNDKVAYAPTMTECTRAADVVVLATPWEEFASLSPDDLKPGAPRPTVIDCWRVLPQAAFEKVCNYVTIGRG